MEMCTVIFGQALAKNKQINLKIIIYQLINQSEPHIVYY